VPCRRPAHDQLERERDECNRGWPAQDQDRDAPAAGDAAGPNDRDRPEHGREEEDREAEREREADPERARLRRLVDVVECVDPCADDSRYLPDRQRGREGEQPGGGGREHAVDRLVDPGVDLGEHLRLDGRPDRVSPELLLVGGAEDAEREQRARDGCDQHAQRDRAGVGQKAVPVEEVDPELDDLLEALPAAFHEPGTSPELKTVRRLVEAAEALLRE
jgi:hypothetical protein